MQVLMMNVKEILTREPSRQVEDINCLHQLALDASEFSLTNLGKCECRMLLEK
jgi:hypothetical protein